MIFVSYSHADEAWRKRFETVSRPLSRSESMVFWSDKNIRMGEWEKQIEATMEDAVAAVLLVSDNFLPPTTSLRRSCRTSSAPPRHAALRSSGPISNPAI